MNVLKIVGLSVVGTLLVVGGWFAAKKEKQIIRTTKRTVKQVHKKVSTGINRMKSTVKSGLSRITKPVLVTLK